ncbi:hypothetical protein [Rhodococcoides fascians]|uniref:hypothetical protein n=1 Tax=Rhodococcoides fascians TaxID=1828 RepID=UPI0005637FAC|nr:hypothetical protein [Rhodococcus fascians]
MNQPVEPLEVGQLVEAYVEDERSLAAKYDNRSLLDEGGIAELHRLAARIYARGHFDGSCVANDRHNRRRQRELDNAKEKS